MHLCGFIAFGVESGCWGLGLILVGNILMVWVLVAGAKSCQGGGMSGLLVIFTCNEDDSLK